VPGTKRALSIELWEEDEDVRPEAGLRSEVLARWGAEGAAALKKRVGVRESSRAVPQVGQVSLSSGISVEQEKHFIGGGLYHYFPLPIQLNKIAHDCGSQIFVLRKLILTITQTISLLRAKVQSTVISGQSYSFS
jgi:hypothetical protein